MGVAVASNATGAVVVGILGVTGAPALALGLLTSAVMGAAYSVVTSLDDRFAIPGSNYDEQIGGNSSEGTVSNQAGTTNHRQNNFPDYNIYPTQTSEGSQHSGSKDSEKQIGPGTKDEETHWRRDNDELVVYDDGTRKGFWERE